jgi:hypothetical protein
LTKNDCPPLNAGLDDGGLKIGKARDFLKSKWGDVMREFEANLLIGGAALKRLRGELEQEEPVNGSSDWLLSGHLHLSPQDGPSVQFNRQYRLELADGRSGQVLFTRVAAQDELELVVDFRHIPQKANAIARE